MERNEIVHSATVDKELPNNWTSLDRFSSNNIEEDTQTVSKEVESIHRLWKIDMEKEDPKGDPTVVEARVSG
uniref:Uncharacterized protein n=1 Tax=Lepeophtheirus salmonis TaxID=72036 RepID=A0A0K2UES5_LEPSM